MDEPVVFVIDDDRAVRDSLSMLVETAGLRVRAFPNAQAFLDFIRPDIAGCVITDLRMPGLSGLELQDRLTELDIAIPLIVLTGHGDVPAAVRALKHGAVDFIEKPFDSDTLLELIRRAIERDASLRETHSAQAEISSRIETLTPREREVMGLVVEGKANKVIAFDLGISERTVELHRARIMRKMRARSLPDLIRMTLS